ncbi:aminobenzoyl-glutamate utilization protein A [Halorientalis persicus]|uniref:Aminobenzoyl-glutamate utilization protein A n=1 Tax=Halorientalis persicus TaxID=1367881 RepID=A0A1H8EJ75_9EURY|nr:amidohydrolase [Halorientalis persicus]SEN19631.1 aminobenzoyl-glutamate utilization protein A [Halorientalis persicus]
MHPVDRDRLVSLRREFHRHPEPAWREFWTTARIVEELDRIGVDDLFVGPDALDADARMGLPADADFDAWRDRARDAGVDPDRLDRLDGGHTGAIAVLDGDRAGPTVALRVDIDGLPREESDDPDHHPAAAGFRSETGAMHACGHDAHATIGLGVLEALSDRDFAGRLNVLFQPAEEVVGGAAPMAESGHIDDVDYLLALHIGLDHPTGQVVAGIEGFLAVSHFRAEFGGEGSHAGGHPAEGRNAVQAMATAVQNLYAIPRHEDGATRVNAGDVGGGTAANIVPEQAYIEGEVRGETTALMEYMRDRADRVLDQAAAMHDCEVGIDTSGQAPSAENDPELVDVVEAVAGRTEGVESVLRHDDLGGSEDATYLMRHVQDRGGKAAFVCVGTDHPGGHHTATFDVDEDSLPVGVAVLADTITHLGREAP